ncbi:hypothetical protein KAR91_33160 [Candidatus Pacearchaeota archaeon]|nr:hypothetical protein [Candidatus Pacearchaeota archaeon]
MIIVSYTIDGHVVVAVSGKRYEYFIDAVHLQPILNMAKKAPFKALNELKRRNRENITR